jgi:hypothetical protein
MELKRGDVRAAKQGFQRKLYVLIWSQVQKVSLWLFVKLFECRAWPGLQFNLESAAGFSTNLATL